jgi:hypothetical protein
MATKSLDELVSQQVLKAIEPAALELSIATTADIDSERQRLHRQWELRLQRSKYECEKAERQYRSVEPENRLVARTLEAAWETTLTEIQRVQEDFRRFEQTTPKRLNEEEIAAIRELSSSIPKLWTSPSTTPGDRKKVIRAMIDRVIVIPDLEHENVDVTIVWHGGFSRRFWQSQKPWPSYTNTLMAVARRLRKTNTTPVKGSCLSACLQTDANPSMPLRKSAGSMATRTFMWGVICNINPRSRNYGLTQVHREYSVPSVPAASAIHGHPPARSHRRSLPT